MASLPSNQLFALLLSGSASYKWSGRHRVQRRMAHWTAAINGPRWNYSFRSCFCSNICNAATWRCNRASLIVALRAALLLLYRAAPICSRIRTRPRVQGPTNPGISLAHMARCRLIRCRSCLLCVCSALHCQRSDAISTTDEIGVTSPLRPEYPGKIIRCHADSNSHHYSAT